MQLEADAEAALSAMSEASVAGEGEALAQHTRRHAELKNEIEKHYAELETASNALEKAASEWDGRLGEVQ
jgi:hypothetical protein